MLKVLCSGWNLFLLNLVIIWVFWGLEDKELKVERQNHNHAKTFAPALKILDRNNVSIIFNNEVVDLSHNRTNSKSDLIDDEMLYDLSLF